MDLKTTIENDECVEQVKQLGFDWVDKVLESKLTLTKP